MLGTRVGFRLWPAAIVLVFFLGLLGLQHFTFILAKKGGENEQALVAWIETQAASSFLQWLERLDYDSHLAGSHSTTASTTTSTTMVSPEVSPEIAIVEINEKSLERLGQFPFPRHIYQTLIQRLETAGAKVVAFDITFPEREWGAGGTGSTGDQIFAQSLKTAKIPVILGYAFTSRGAEEMGIRTVDKRSLKLLRKHALPREQVRDDAFVHSMTGREPVLPHYQLLSALGTQSGLGFFTAEADEDSVIRRATAVMGFETLVFPSLAVRAVSAYLHEGQPHGLVLQGSDRGLRLVSAGSTEAFTPGWTPLSPSGSVLLRYYGAGRNFPYYEFSDLIEGKIPAANLKGKIIFVGATAQGLKDIRANPLSRNYPGVEVHATLASNILTQNFLVKDERFYQYGYGFLLGLGLLVAGLVAYLSPLFAFGSTLVVMVSFRWWSDKFFAEGVVVPVWLPVIAAGSVLFAGILYRYFTEEKEKRRIRSAFSRYVSTAVVEEILKDPSKLRLGGEKKILTVMFCDLVGFTKLSETMDPVALTERLNEYFTRMTKIILKNSGTLDKYMGDAIMCFWGAPVDLPNHAELGCQTALEIQQELAAINREWQAQYGITIGLRIGLHSGEMNVGNMGSEQVFSYTVMGDNVNLASRLEGVNNVYGTQILVSKETAESSGQKFLFRPLDFVQVKGREEAVEIQELLGTTTSITNSTTEEWLVAFAQGRKHYQAGQWAEAEAAFRVCASLKPDDTTSQVFIERVKELASTHNKHTKEVWSGVWKLRSK